MRAFALSGRKGIGQFVLVVCIGVGLKGGPLEARLFAQVGADLIQPISGTMRSYADLQRLREACGRPLSLQILGWLEKDLSPAQIESVAGLAVFPLVPLMTITAALQSNLATLVAQKNARGLPLPQTSIDAFKKLIGFDDVERLQETYEMS